MLVVRLVASETFASNSDDAAAELAKSAFPPEESSPRRAFTRSPPFVRGVAREVNAEVEGIAGT